MKMFRQVAILAFVLLAGGLPLNAQDDGLLSWDPNTGSSSFGPYISPSGYMNMWQDGSCVNYMFVGASVRESWTCGVGSAAQVTGSAGLAYCPDDCIGDYPCGVEAAGLAAVLIGGQWTPVDEEYAENDCDDYLNESGGPHPWVCGNGGGLSG